MVDPDPVDHPVRRPRPLGRRGLVAGVFILLILAIVGARLIRGTSGSVIGVTRALAPFPGFPVATPARIRLGASADRYAAYGPIAIQGLVDWRTQFARAGRPWQDPPIAVDVPPFVGPHLRAHLIWFAGARLGGWAQQLMGIPGLLEVARRKGQIAEAAIGTETQDLVACLIGAWGRSLIAPADLLAVAPAGEARWVTRGLASGVPSVCARAVGG